MMLKPDEVREERINLHSNFKNAIAIANKKVDCPEQRPFNNRQLYRSINDYCQLQTTSNFPKLSPSQVVYARQRHPSGRRGRPVADRFVPRELREPSADWINREERDQRSLLMLPIPATKRRLPPRGMANPAVAGFIEGLRELARERNQRKQQQQMHFSSIKVNNGVNDGCVDETWQHRCHFHHISSSRHSRTRKTASKNRRVLNREHFFFKNAEAEKVNSEWSESSGDEMEDEDDDADSGVGFEGSTSASSPSSAASTEELIFDIEL